MLRNFRRILAPILFLLTARAPARSQDAFRLFTDNITYNAGSEVRVKTGFPDVGSFPPSSRLSADSMGFVAVIRYAGEHPPVVAEVPLPASLFFNTLQHPAEYVKLWSVPPNAQTGRYEIEIRGLDAHSHATVFQFIRAATFAVHRKPLRIERIELDKTFYISGDPVAARVTIRNLGARLLSGLRVEFSDRYWPWIAQSSERAGVDFTLLASDLSLPAASEREVESTRAAVAKEVKQPSVHQYAIVVWDHERKNVYDIAFSTLTFIRPPGADLPKPYPGQYLYPDVEKVNVSSYRNFYPPELGSPAIQFDRAQTMFASGSEGRVSFEVTNPTGQPWHKVSVRVRWLGPNGSEVASQEVTEGADLDPRGPPLKKEARFPFPADASGIYRVQVEVSGPSGEVLATQALELGVNPLPKSILVFCAHQDDEGAHAGTLRAAVENHIPVHVVYFTGGDAGSCDRYYQHSCDPAEALNFGALRMEEVRAALGHLGVGRENIYFLGLPDGGSGQIWSNHVHASDPYLSVLLASDHTPYEEAARPNLPYARDAVVEATKEFIRKFRPEVIFTGHPDERHVDHRTNNWFVVKALQELVREGAVAADLTLLVDQVYGPGPQAHAPYLYRKHVLHVSGEAAARAQEAWWFHQSQDGNRAEGNLRDFDRLPRTEVHWQILDWKDHEGWNE